MGIPLPPAARRLIFLHGSFSGRAAARGGSRAFLLNPLSGGLVVTAGQSAHDEGATPTQNNFRVLSFITVTFPAWAALRFRQLPDLSVRPTPICSGVRHRTQADFCADFEEGAGDFHN